MLRFLAHCPRSVSTCIPYFHDQTPPSISSRPRIIAAPPEVLNEIVATLDKFKYCGRNKQEEVRKFLAHYQRSMSTCKYVGCIHLSHDKWPLRIMVLCTCMMYNKFLTDWDSHSISVDIAQWSRSLLLYVA